MSKIRKDSLGIYVITGGYTFRPGADAGVGHAYWMGDLGLRKGDTVKARHLSQSQIAKIITEDGRVCFWSCKPEAAYQPMFFPAECYGPNGLRR